MERCPRAFTGVVVLMSAVVAVAPLHAQAVRGTVRDSVTGVMLSDAAIAVRDVKDSTQCSVVSGSDGRFWCALPDSGAYSVHVRRVGYVPATVDITVRAQRLDTLDLAITIVRIATILDTVRTRGTGLFDRMFSVTPGRTVFQRHMALGKGHFILGFEVLASGQKLSEYLVKRIPDSLRIVPMMPQPPAAMVPSVPVADGKFLTSTVWPHCLYVRVNRHDVVSLLGQGVADDIDAIIPPKAVRGVELYLTFHDVPPEWRAEAYPTSVVAVERRNGTSVVMGDVGRQRQSTRTVRTRVSRCPLLQIWTSNAW